MKNNWIIKIWDLLASRNFAVFVFILGITHVLILLCFAFLIPNWWVKKIGILLPYKVFYALFFINLLLCEIKWLPVILKQCKKPDIPDSLENLIPFRQKLELGNIDADIPVTKKILRRNGFKVIVPKNKQILLYGVKGLFSPLGNLLLHASFFFLLLGVLLNLLYRFEGTALIPEGFTFISSKKNYRSIKKGTWSSIPPLAFNLKKISATFWEGKLLFTSLNAHIFHPGGHDVAKLSYASNVNGSSVSIAGFGYAPKYILKDYDGKILDKRNVFLNIFVPGLEDFFYISGYPYKIYISFYPDFLLSNGKIINQSMNPKNPAYKLRILRGRISVFEGIIRQGEWAKFDGLSISFPSFVRWGNFRIIKAPGRPFIWIGFLLMVLGMAWRLFFYRKEIMLYWDSTGKLFLAGRFAHYQKLNENWLKVIAIKYFKGTK